MYRKRQCAMKNRTTVLAAEEQIYARDVMKSTRHA
jgi:hypothetical protein